MRHRPISVCPSDPVGISLDKKVKSGDFSGTKSRLDLLVLRKKEVVVRLEEETAQMFLQSNFSDEQE